ncbi:hypothetical protein [Cellulophaga sp. L1A9]|uniref:hypothetical protein n=1 Tax=Cellulophaga sp. L1A9 TaxID=2686362 RepID=UPI00131C5ECD|nr:hypothetical protein [Cellulophaga sp. L1A9]
MIQKTLIVIIFFLGFTALGQETQKDTTEISSYNRQFNSEKQVSIRVGAGIQKSFYTELGLALHTCNYGDTGFFSNDIYSALEWTPNKEKDIYGLKIGYEVNAYLLNLGLEAKYLTDFKERDFVFTPKIGLGLYGDVNIFYGYTISTSNNPFSGNIGRHQLSIVLNLNKHFLSA